MLDRRSFNTTLTDEEIITIINKEIMNSCKRWNINLRSIPAQVRVNIVPTVKTLVAKKLHVTYDITWLTDSSPASFSSTYQSPSEESEESAQPVVRDMNSAIMFTGEGIIELSEKDAEAIQPDEQHITEWFTEVLHDYIDTATRYVIGSLKNRQK